MYFATGRVFLEDYSKMPRVDRSSELHYTLDENVTFPAKEAYEKAMAVRGGRILEAARRNGRFFHGKSLPALAGYAPVRLAASLSPGIIKQRFDWIYGYDVTAGRDLGASGLLA